MSFKEFIRRGLGLVDVPELDEVYVTEDGIKVTVVRGGEFYKGRFDRSPLNPEQATRRVHVYGRRGNEIVLVRPGGSVNQGTRGRVSEKNAEKLRSLGILIPPDRIIEWTVVKDAPTLLLE